MLEGTAKEEKNETECSSARDLCGRKAQGAGREERRTSGGKSVADNLWDFRDKAILGTLGWVVPRLSASRYLSG